MAFNGAFTITPTAEPSTFLLTDTSTGSDGGLTGRVVNLYQADGTLLVSPIAWAIGDTTKLINVLTTDIALNVSVTWTSSSPLAPPSTYVYSLIYAFVKYGQWFVYNMTQYQQSHPNVVQTASWYNGKLQIMCEILAAQNAIDTGEDLAGAQYCIASYNYLITNQNSFFADGNY